MSDAKNLDTVDIISNASPKTWIKLGIKQARNEIVNWLINEFSNEVFTDNEVIIMNSELLEFISNLALRIQADEPFKGKLDV